ncbi:hypothetical protein ASALC70_00334 [Alcanivorax sp. ALC70]|nr:hypothetical protein [Alcanivorax sp. ZXX171]QJX01756.1 Caa(3)-type oxidase subunit IV [Alcanivorax sp. IO_7]UWN48156.1 hypothetical protein ASALC70_00334 [Alcanivorax sp. ALC70]
MDTTSRDKTPPSATGRFVALYALLLVLLGANMAGTLLPLGAYAIPARLAVAVAMVAVIATTFMRLRQGSVLVRLVALMSLLWILFLFVLTFADFLTR